MNISKRDVLDLRKRLTKKACTFERVTGCYVNGEKQIILTFEQSFADLSEDEMFRYLDIAKKTLSGTLGNNLLQLSFERDEQAAEKQQFLWNLKGSKLKNNDILKIFYEEIIKDCDIVGNYLILLFHDVYDVIKRTSDRAKLDESEEVYEYILCALCPVELSEASLGYNENEHKISVCERDWLVKMPEMGFLYPAFADFGSDCNSIMYYIKNAKDSHPDFITNALNCTPIRTSTEQKSTFECVVKDAFGSDEDTANEIFMQIQRNINGYIQIQEDDVSDEQLTNEIVSDLLSDTDISDEIKQKIETTYKDIFSEQPPTAKQILDTKTAAIADQKAQTKALQQKVLQLESELSEKAVNISEPEQKLDGIMEKLLSVLPDIEQSELKTTKINGKDFLLVPIETE